MKKEDGIWPIKFETHLIHLRFTNIYPDNRYIIVHERTPKLKTDFTPSKYGKAAKPICLAPGDLICFHQTILGSLKLGSSLAWLLDYLDTNL